MTLNGRPFHPSDLSALYHVKHDEGAASLDAPEPETIIVDKWFSVRRQQHKLAFPGADRDRCLSSIAYWSPVPPSGEDVVAEVDYYDTFRIPWTKRPEDRWVAVSVDAFWPPERDSADVLIPIGECDEGCRNG
jgi:hypothetical protein